MDLANWLGHTPGASSHRDIHAPRTRHTCSHHTGATRMPALNLLQVPPAENGGDYRGETVASRCCSGELPMWMGVPCPKSSHANFAGSEVSCTCILTMCSPLTLVKQCQTRAQWCPLLRGRELNPGHPSADILATILPRIELRL